MATKTKVNRRQLMVITAFWFFLLTSPWSPSREIFHYKVKAIGTAISDILHRSLPRQKKIWTTCVGNNLLTCWASASCCCCLSDCELDPAVASVSSPSQIFPAPPATDAPPAHQKPFFLNKTIYQCARTYGCSLKDRSRRDKKSNATLNRDHIVSYSSSVPDLWHFNMDPDSRVCTQNYGSFQIWILLRILLFPSVAFKMSTTKKVFSTIFLAYYLLWVH